MVRRRSPDDLLRSITELPLAYDSVAHFQARLTEFVRAEQATEAARHEDQSRHPITVRWTSARTIEFRLTKRQCEGISAGNRISLLSDGVVVTTGALEGFGPRLVPGRMQARLDSLSPLFGETRVHMEFDVHNVGFRRQLSALDGFKRADEWWQCLLLGHLSRIRNSFDTPIHTGDLQQASGNLHPSQEEAIRYALKHPFALIQGPPGTGKSTCIVEQTLAYVHARRRVLIASRTNVSCDHLLRMVNRRIGPLRDICVVRVVGQSYQDMVPRDIRPDCSHHIAKQTHQDEQAIIAAADIIIATTCAVGGQRFANFSPDSLIVDEANQLVDPEFLIPLRLNPETVTMYGDFNQIGPYCYSVKTKESGYGKSLMERIHEISGQCSKAAFKPIMLTGQFRMHPELAVFPSMEFYDGRLTSGCLARDKAWALAGVHYPNPMVPLLFWDLNNSTEQHSSDGESFFNINETIALGRILERLSASEVPAASIGVITFYAAQVDYTLDQIHKICQAPTQWLQNIEVNTVDAYEGRDVDFVILICVRSNIHKRVGFLDDSGRMNVALTRAKYGLFVVGSSETLEGDAHWRKFVAYCREKGVMVGDLSE
jgi:regulator of nonsense transcripts 1